MSIPEYTGEIKVNAQSGEGYLWDRDSNKVFVTVRRTKNGFLAVDPYGRIIELVAYPPR
jgi:hypothetical protein